MADSTPCPSCGTPLADPRPADCPECGISLEEPPEGAHVVREATGDSIAKVPPLLIKKNTGPRDPYPGMWIGAAVLVGLVGGVMAGGLGLGGLLALVVTLGTLAPLFIAVALGRTRPDLARIFAWLSAGALLFRGLVGGALLFLPQISEGKFPFPHLLMVLAGLAAIGAARRFGPGPEPAAVPPADEAEVFE